jgi:hypothetical protein
MTELPSPQINPDDPNYKVLNMIMVNLNDVRTTIVELQKDGFTEIGLADLLWHLKSAEKEDT